MVSNEKKRNLIREHKTDIILFGLSGLMAFTADYTALLLTERISHNLLAATTMGILAGFIVSYILNAFPTPARSLPWNSQKARGISSTGVYIKIY